MEPDEFDKIENLSEDVYDKFEELHKKGVFVDIEKKVKEICSNLKEEYSVSVNIDVEVFSAEKEKSIFLVKRGIECSGGHETYLATSGSTSHRYVVNGHIIKLPHDYCPHCWAEWDFKLLNPSCEKGKVSRSNP